MIEEPVLPPVLVVRPQNGEVIVDLLNDPERHQIAWTLTLENGEVRKGIAKTIRKSTCASTRSLVLPNSGVRLP